MKSIVLIALLTIFGIFTVSGQIKIGDNPQNIDSTSLLELESSSRVLVISRVSTLKMEAIAPQRGGVVYNTDTECLHYFDGSQWVNLCDAVSFNLTNDPIENINTTISIVDNGNTINLEVAPNSIRSENIIDGGINGDDIQDNSIGESKLGDDSVSSNELRDNSVGSSEIRDGSVQTTDMANTIPNQVMTSDENGIVLWRDASGLQGATGDEITITGAGTVADPLTLTDAIQNNINDNTVTFATHILEDSDTDDQNETLTDVRLEGNNLILTESGIETTLDLSPLNNSGTDNQNLNLTGNILEIERGNTVNLNGFLDNTDDQQLSIVGNRISLTNGGAVDLPPGTVDTDDQQLSIAGNRISLTDGGFVDLPAGTVNTDNQNLSLTGNTINISGGTGVDLTPILGGGATDGVVTNVALAGTDLNFTGANGGFNGSVSLAGLGGGAADGALTNVELAGTDLEFTSSPGGFTGTVSLAGLGGGGAADGVITNMELTGTDLIVTGTAPGFSGTIPLGTLGGGTDSQQLTLEQPGNLLTLVDGGTPIDLTPFLNNQTAGEVTVAATPSNYTPNSPDVEGHLTGIDAALLNAVTPNLANVLNAGNSAGNSQINDLLDPTLPQDAATRAYVEGRITDINAAGGADGVITNVFLTGTEINFTGSIGGFDGTIDLDLTFVTETELAALVTDDADADPENELSDISLTGTTLNLTNPVTGATGIDLDPTFATDAELVAAILVSDTADGDTSDTNEIQTITSTDNSVTVTPNGDDFDLSVVGGSDDQNLESAILTGSDLAINIEGGNNVTADLGELTTDVELAAAILASETADGDTSDTNELQTITSPDASVTVTPVGNNYELTVAGGGTDNQNLESAILTGSDLAINIEGGNNVTADLGELTTDVELAAAILASETADGDTSDTNELQTIISSDASVTIAPNGIGFDLSVSEISGGPSGNIANNSITQGDIGPNAIGAGEIQSDAVSSDEIEDDSITNADINSAAAIDGSKINPNFVNQNIQTTGTLTSGALTANGALQVNGDVNFTGTHQAVPDYVFQEYFAGYSTIKEDYKFKTLKEIEDFLKKHHHLPGVTSAAQAKKNGFWSLSQSNLQNLEKIEELFLHTIEQEKKIEALAAEKEALAQKLQRLEKDMDLIKQLLQTKNNNE
ncbi:hypothetical protein BFP77_06920 [Maribacter sp. 4U21]|uniref:beta strand repeat-containing protein n=1 Tax=Maribacter sp. 4U21 TaxID=1889779 RepID=UPI000C156A7B|nr:hypothetical protein [Maribacter sp. 4U21]PIB29232.1 hypothetical protein BFP77_06920 [Maribacter sp. 4U21]